MAKFYQDFVGLNTFTYDSSSFSDSNLLGWDQPIESYKNIDFLSNFNTFPSSAVFFNALMSRRGNVYGYSTWRQLRVSDNPITRRQRKENIFSYTTEGDAQDTLFLKQPVVSDNLPVSLIGDVAAYNERLGIFENKPVEIKTSFGNEIAFFANQEANEYFNTILETDDNYEALKEMYLDGGLDDEGSLLDAFSLLTYRQSIWPKQRYAYLDQTRSRKFYVNTFWRDDRDDREVNDVETSFNFTAPSQSMWPLDAALDFATRQRPVKNSSIFTITMEHRIGGDTLQNTEGGEGILQSSYSQIGSRFYYNTSLGGSSFTNAQPLTSSIGIVGTLTDPNNVLSSSIYYSRRHTIKSMFSNYNPSFASLSDPLPYVNSPEGVDHSLLTLDGSASLMLTSSLFEGVANWDAPAQAGKTPFYDSYDEFSQDIRRKGKGYSIIPEFRISSHVEDYTKMGINSELKSIFEASGALSQNTTTENQSDFYKVLSNSEFLRHFDLIKKDHESFANEKILTLKCKALKKFLPYEGFYPAQRTVQLGEQFVKSYGDYVDSRQGNSVASTNVGSFKLQPLLEPLFAPGILFNTIKSGVGVDYPLFTAESEPYIVSSSDNNYNDTWKTSSAPVPGPYHNYYWAGSKASMTDTGSLRPAFDTRIPFEALVEPEQYLANLRLIVQEPHPFGLPYTGSNEQFLDYYSQWMGQGDELYKKMANNILAEIPELFLENKNMSTLSSLEDGDPNFGNAKAGNYYMMRVKMKRSRVGFNQPLGGFYGSQVIPPQDVVTYQYRVAATDTGIVPPITGGGNVRTAFSTKESLTMYSRPTAFGPPTYGGNGYGTYRTIEFRECGSWWGTNYPYTPPYYHGEAWCDMIFYANETKKYSLDEIMSSSAEYKYQTRFWWNGTMDALRDVTGYSGSSLETTSSALNNRPITNGTYASYSNSPWKSLIEEGDKTITMWPSGDDGGPEQIASETYFGASNWGTSTENLAGYGTCDGASIGELRWAGRPNSSGSTYTIEDQLIQHPFYMNYNAMQLESSVNLFGKGTVRKVYDQDKEQASEVASADTVRGKTRWIIQPKFETPILNFKKYENLTGNGGIMPLYAQESVPRGMWHQYGDIPDDPNVGVFLQVEDIPRTWLKGALGITADQRNIGSLADLIGFSKDPVRLGEVASQKEISECVVAVPFIEKDGTRKFFSIPREDIASCINASKREIDGNFPAGGPPKAGDTVYQMVKKMQKYVFPPSMDFVKYEEIDPFAMYIFEFKHTLSKQDLADIWQNLPPEIGTQMEEAEASISHELLAHELLGGGAVIKNGELDENAEGKGIPSNIQWMIFKVKKRAKTSYFDKIVAKKGTTEDTSGIQLEGVTSMVSGKKDKEITYNWPYDFFSLVELVKIDAEVSFANIANDDKGQKSIKKVESTKTRNPSMINKARGKGRTE
jgi:hypothetical protein